MQKYGQSKNLSSLSLNRIQFCQEQKTGKLTQNGTAFIFLKLWDKQVFRFPELASPTFYHMLKNKLFFRLELGSVIIRDFAPIH